MFGRTRRTSALAVPAALLALGLSACGKDDEGALSDAGGTTSSTSAAPPTATSDAPPTTSTAAKPSTTANGCKAVEAPEPKGEQSLSKPTLKLDPEKAYTATIVTNCGVIKIRLSVRDFPKTTANFAQLVRSNFYDNLTFDRVSRPSGQPFVVQGGDPQGTEGDGGPGYEVVEQPPSDTKYERGVVAMAKTEIEDPGTSGSQFFIVTAKKVDLPPDYAVVGKVIGSLRAVDKISNADTDPTTEIPTDPVVIDSIRITPPA